MPAPGHSAHGPADRMQILQCPPAVPVQIKSCRHRTKVLHSPVAVLPARLSAPPLAPHADHQSHKLWKPPHVRLKPNYSGTQESNSCLCQQTELLAFYDNYLVKIDNFNASSHVFWSTSFGLGCWMLFIESEKCADYEGKQSV